MYILHSTLTQNVNIFMALGRVFHQRCVRYQGGKMERYCPVKLCVVLARREDAKRNSVYLSGAKTRSGHFSLVHIPPSHSSHTCIVCDSHVSLAFSYVQILSSPSPFPPEQRLVNLENVKYFSQPRQYIKWYIS